MGQKCNPTGLRIGVIKTGTPAGMQKEVTLQNTLLLMIIIFVSIFLTLLRRRCSYKGEIERDAKRVRINIHCAKPGMVIGKQGAEIPKSLRQFVLRN